MHQKTPTTELTLDRFDRNFSDVRLSSINEVSILWSTGVSSTSDHSLQDTFPETVWTATPVGQSFTQYTAERLGGSSEGSAGRWYSVYPKKLSWGDLWGWLQLTVWMLWCYIYCLCCSSASCSECSGRNLGYIEFVVAKTSVAPTQTLTSFPNWSLRQQVWKSTEMFVCLFHDKYCASRYVSTDVH